MEGLEEAVALHLAEGQLHRLRANRAYLLEESDVALRVSAIVTLLEAVSRQLSEVRDAQKQMAADLKKVARAGR